MTLVNGLVVAVLVMFQTIQSSRRTGSGLCRAVLLTGQVLRRLVLLFPFAGSPRSPWTLLSTFRAAPTAERAHTVLHDGATLLSRK